MERSNAEGQDGRELAPRVIRLSTDPVDIPPDAFGDQALVRAWKHYLVATSRSISILDPHDRVIRLVNASFARIHGGDPGDFTGRPFDSVLTADSVKTLTRLIERVEHEGYARAELDHIRLDGTIVATSTEVAADLDSGGAITALVLYDEDPTTHRTLEADRDAAARDFEGAFRSGPIGKALVALDGRFLRVNSAFCRITGYSEQELTARTFLEITHPEDLEADLNLVAALIAGEIPSYQMEKRYFTKDGGMVWVLLSVWLVRDGASEPRHFVSQIQDISERKRAETRLHEIADTDTVTGLWSRRRFETELGRQVSRCRRYSEQAGLLLVDLDDFKAVNDTHGHRAGDRLLGEVGQALSGRLRESDGAARIGGDEFAILLPNASVPAALIVAESIRADIAALRFEHDDDEVTITASVGVMQVDSSSGTDEDVMIAVDRALYRAKRAGRDRTALAEPLESQA